MTAALRDKDHRDHGKTRLWPGAALFLLLWISYILLRSGETVTDTLMASILVPNLAQGHGIDLSHAQVGTDLLRDQPAYYFLRPPYGLVGIYPVGMVLLAAPLQVILWLSAFLVGLDVSVLSAGFGPTRFLLEKISAGFLVAASGLATYRCLKLLVPPAYAVALSLFYLFGSGALSVLAQGLWQQTGVNLVCIVLLHFLLARRTPPSRLNEAAFFAALGFLFSIRPTAAVWGFFFALSFWRCFGRPSWIAAASACVGVLPGLAWNLALFGHPLGGYAVTPVEVFDADPAACAGRAWLILFGWHKGLITMNPLLVGMFLAPLAIPTLVPRYRKALSPLVFAMACSLLLCSTNPSWHGGRSFGPRYMLDGLGVGFVLAAVGIAHAAARFPRLTASTAGFAGVCSLGLHIFGAIGARLQHPWLVELHQRWLLP